jgi:predicted permease
MSALMSRVRSLCRNLLRRKRVEADLDAELRASLQLLVDEQIKGGVCEDHARRAALLELGGLEQIKEHVRDVKGGALLGSVWQDVRFALRSLVRAPTLTAIAVLSLGIGIGANASLFSLVDRLVLTTLPVREPDRLFILYSNNRAGFSDGMSVPDFELIRASFNVFDGVLARTNRPHAIDTGSQIAEARVEIVSGNYFDVLGVAPVRGRLLTADDDRAGAEIAIVVGHKFWQRQLGADPDVTSRRMRIAASVESPVFSAAVFRIVGVAPEGFAGVVIGEPPDIYLPLHSLPVIHSWAAESFKRPNNYIINVMARLKPGVTLEHAQTEMWTRFPNFDQVARGSSITGARVVDGHTRKLRLREGRYGISGVREEYTYSLLLLMALVAVVLVIACANLANLLLVRGMARTREIAARLALGATPARLARQWLTESLLMSAAGGVLGLGIAFGTTALLLSFIPPEEHSYLAFRVNARNLLFTAFVTMVTGVVFGALPALRVSRVPLNAAFTGASGRVIGGRRAWITRAVVVVQVAVSLILVTGAGLFARTLSKLNAESGGFNRKTVVYAQLGNTQRYTPQQQGALFTEILQRLNRVPQLASAGGVSSVPIAHNVSWGVAIIAGYTPQPDEPTTIYTLTAWPGYFGTLGIPLRAGRDFDERDRSAPPAVAIVNERFVARFFKGRNPIGGTFRLAGPSNRDVRIIGVIPTTRLEHFREADRETVYFPAGPNGRGRIVVRSKEGFDAGVGMSAIRSVVRAVDSNLTVETFEMEEAIQTSLARDRLVAELSAGLALLGLALACIGVYGVMAYTVTSRTAEIGIRIATGADRWDILRMVLKETLSITAIGIAIGVPAALAAARLVEAQLFSLSPSDPFTVGSAIAIMMTVAVLAGYVPARRAAMLDPIRALRYE